MALLKFENSLERRIVSPSLHYRRRSRPRGPALALVLVVVVALLAGLIGVWTWRQYRHRDVAALGQGFFAALQVGDLEKALEFCPESEQGLARLMADEQRVKREPPLVPDPAALTEPRDQRLAQLQALRREAADMGLDWDRAVPAAFTGVIADLHDEEELLRPVTSVTGFLCLVFDGRVYGLELTARKCPEGYVITGLWGWDILTAAPDELRSFTAERYRAFTAEQERRTDDASVTARRLYRRL